MIEATQRKQMAAGTTLVARYKKEDHRAEVVEGEDGKLRYRLADGREFKSPSAAGRAVMGGTACNGWRFWSVQGAEPATEDAAPAPKKRPGRAKAAPLSEVAVEAAEDATS